MPWIQRSRVSDLRRCASHYSLQVAKACWHYISRRYLARLCLADPSHIPQMSARRLALVGARQVCSVCQRHFTPPVLAGEASWVTLNSTVCFTAVLVLAPPLSPHLPRRSKTSRDGESYADIYIFLYVNGAGAGIRRGALEAEQLGFAQQGIRQRPGSSARGEHAAP